MKYQELMAKLQAGESVPDTTVHVSFYHKDTGLLNGSHFMTSLPETVPLNTPPDHVVIDGHHDHLCKKVDLTTGQVIDYQPPAPSDNHCWNDATKRWELTAAERERNQRRAAAQARISELERDVQPGLLRAMALGQEGAKEKLAAMDAEIASLRSGLNV